MVTKGVKKKGLEIELKSSCAIIRRNRYSRKLINQKVAGMSAFINIMAGTTEATKVMKVNSFRV